MDSHPVSGGFPQGQWRRNRLAINIAAALMLAGYTFIMPFLPLYVRELGVEGEAEIASWSGLLITIAPLLSALLTPAWGRLGDRIGLRIMVERCTLAMAVHWGLFGFAQSVYHLLALRILLGLFGGFAALSIPLLVSTTPKAHMSRSIGILQTVQMISSAVGPLAGGALADWVGIRKTCLLSSGFAAGALVLIHWLYKEPAPAAATPTGRAANPALLFREAIALPSFGIMVTVLYFVSFIERSFTPIVPIFILGLGTSIESAARTAGIIISLGMFSEAISAYVLGNWLKKGSPRKILLLRLATGALLCFPMGLVWATSQLLCLRLALGLLAGGSMVVVYTLGSRVVPPETRGTSFSILSSAALLGAATGPVTAGVLAHLDIRAIFFFNSIVFLLLLVLSWISLRDRRMAEPPAAD